MDYPTSCDCDVKPHSLGAKGWGQCGSCGLVQPTRSMSEGQRYPLPVKLRRILREGWHRRQPGGGNTNGHDFVVAHFEDGPEAHYHTRIDREVERQLERGANPVEIWRTDSAGVSRLLKTHRPAWLLELRSTRRRRPSSLAAVDAARVAA